MKIGINISIDVTKLDKTKFYIGKKGTYVNLTAFVDTENVDEYGQNGGVSESQTKEERDAGNKSVFVGNTKLFWKDDQGGQQQPPPSSEPRMGGDDSGVPF